MAHICPNQIHTDYYVVEITDNGLGMPPHRLQEINHCLTCRLPIPSKSGGYGIYNVNERIKYILGRNMDCTITANRAVTPAPSLNCLTN